MILPAGELLKGALDFLGNMLKVLATRSEGAERDSALDCYGR